MNVFFDLIRPYSLIILLSIGTVFNIIWLFRSRERLAFKWYAVLLLAVLHTVLGVLSVKLFAFLETGDGGNMSLYGGVFFMPAFYFALAKLSKRPAADVFDVFTVCMLFTLMCARLNCIISGCCTGMYIPGTELRWPTRELEIVYYLVMLALLIPRSLRGEQRGCLYPLYMASYGTLRFIIEFFRTSTVTNLFHISHIWSGVSLALGFSIYIELKKINNNRKVRRK